MIHIGSTPYTALCTPRRRLSTASVGSMVLIDLATGSKAREIAWILEDTRAVMRNLKNGLDECYALLAPIDPGVTLAVSSPLEEKVKGVMTRLGTRIVRAVSSPFISPIVSLSSNTNARESPSSSEPSPAKSSP
ncbi:hypothetical protein ACRALDRAFT_2036073 [Sodiomyces alcalophilus JCM 7366]|uniref:uncharacterized protein n=1 Tax=Sodiomyces alcalophilus JCM 7366 TaxID=591952 RepID=UPI0039B65CDC